MTDQAPPKSSFSPYRKWGIGLHVCFIVLLVLSVLVMVNYLSRDYFVRFHLSGRGRIPLAVRTVKFLESLTNDVNVTIYYDKNDAIYSMVADLLKEYKQINPRIHVRTVDYLRDPGAAAQLKERYKSLASAEAKDLVIFESQDKFRFIDGKALANYVTERMPNEKELEFRRKPISFAGEKAFTSALIWVTSKSFKAYFLEGDGEHDIESGDEAVGFLKFASVLRENSIQTEKLSLLGTNQVPMDCNLLVIAGPRVPVPDMALDKIEQYLNQGGRLLALFNVFSVHKETGLERILAKWGVSVGTNTIKDVDNSREPALGTDVIVRNFSSTHPIVAPLQTLAIQLILPRSIGKLQVKSQSADAPRVEEIAFTGPNAVSLEDAQSARRRFPMIVAVEKGAIKDVITERGTTRMVVVGDSIFLVNRQIESGANKDFAGFAVNWLLDQPQLLQGLEPRPIIEYRLVMSSAQLQSAEWLLLAGMPATILAFGSLVWLRRRR
jgi:ABC-type uncharacterized transport system involved in gliding motility auxiliary subunit